MCIFLVFILVTISIIAACDSSTEGSLSDSSSHELNMVVSGTQLEIQGYESVVEDFHENYSDIRVNLTALPADNYAETILIRLQGSAPDLFYMNDRYAIDRLIETNQIVSLTEFLTSEDSYVSLDEFSDGLLESVRQEDDIYGLPVDANPTLMFYNKELFKHLNIKTPQEYYDEGAWDWEAMEEVTGQMVEQGELGFISGIDTSSIHNWVRSNGTELYSEQHKVLIDEDARVLETFQFLSRMLKEQHFIYERELAKSPAELFTTNQAGFIAGDFSFVQMFHDIDSLDYDVIPWPTNTGNDFEPASVTTNYLLASDNENKEAAMTFLSFFVSRHGQEIRFEDTGVSIPSVKGADHKIAEGKKPEHIHYFKELRNTGAVNDFQDSVPGLETDLLEIFNEMFLGDISAEAMITRAGIKAREHIYEH